MRVIDAHYHDHAYEICRKEALSHVSQSQGVKNTSCLIRSAYCQCSWKFIDNLDSHFSVKSYCNLLKLLVKVTVLELTRGNFVEM